MAEIQQPSLEIPILDDPMTWARITRVKEKWLENIAPQLNLDAHKLILGMFLAKITGDDTNSFGLNTGKFKQQEASLSKGLIFERLDHEIETPYLPEVIKKQLVNIKKELELLDWNKEEDFNKAREIHRVKVSNFTQRQIALNQNLRDAMRYSKEKNKILDKYWRQFLYD